MISLAHATRPLALMALWSLLIVLPGFGIAAEATKVPAEFLTRLVRILDQSETDPEGTLVKLATLADRVQTREARLSMVVREQAALLLQLDRLAEARILLTNALADRRVEFAPELRYLLSQIHLVEGDFSQALSELETWMSLAEEPPGLSFFFLGYAYLRLDRFDEAAVALETAISLVESPASQWVEMLAYIYVRLDRTAEAVALLEGLIVKLPQEARYWRALASIFLLMENVPRGTATLTVLDQIEPLPFQDARRLAQLLGYIGMPEPAAAVLQDAFGQATDPITNKDRMLLATLLILAREHQDAVIALEALLTDSRDGRAGILLGQLYLQRERYDNARTALLKALDAFGEDAPPETYYLLAVVEINLENPQAAGAALSSIEDDADYAARVKRLRTSIATTPSP